MKNKRMYKNKIFLRFLVSYIFVLLVPILIGIYSYNEALKIVAEEVKNNSLNVLMQSRDNTDRDLKEVENMIARLSLNSKLNEALDQRINIDENNYLIKEITDELSSNILTNDFIISYCILLKDSDYIIMQDTVYNKSLFFNYVCLNDKYKDIDVFNNKFNKFYSGEFYKALPMNLQNANRNIIACIYSIPLIYSEPEGAIAVLIEEDEIKRRLSYIDITKGGWAYIIDEKNRIITSVSGDGENASSINISMDSQEGFKQMKINGRDMIVTYVRSLHNKWTYVAVLPVNVAMAKVNNIKMVTIILTYISFVIGIMISYFLAYKNTLPIKKVSTMLKEFLSSESGETYKDDYNALQGGVYKLIIDSSRMKAVMDEQMPLVRATFTERLLKGEFSNIEEIEALSEYCGIEIKSNNYVVLILKVNNLKSFSSSDHIQKRGNEKITIKYILSEVLGKKILINDINENKIAIIQFMDSNDKNAKIELENTINNIYKEIYNALNIKINIGIGNICEDVFLIRDSLSQACEALSYISVNKNVLYLWYSDIPKKSDGYFYPIETEMKIMNYIKAGENKEVKKMFELIYTENFSNRVLNSEMLRQLMADMKGTLIKLQNHITVPNEAKEQIDNIDYLNNVEEAYNEIKNICISICEEINEQKRSHNVKLRDKIIKYIEETHMESALSLAKIALRFDLTETYTSQFFKEQVGENFSSYIVNLRIDHACELLKNSDLNINEIAEKVGYNSAHVFRRAFKRVRDISPAEYRSIYKINKE